MKYFIIPMMMLSLMCCGNDKKKSSQVPELTTEEQQPTDEQLIEQTKEELEKLEATTKDEANKLSENQPIVNKEDIIAEVNLTDGNHPQINQPIVNQPAAHIDPQMAVMPSTVTPVEPKIKKIFGNSKSFAALREDGSVITWGDETRGGNSSEVADKLKDVETIYSNDYSFAALRRDGSVITWGDPKNGGNSSDLEFTKIVSTGLGNSVVETETTINISSLSNLINTPDCPRVKEISANSSAYIAICSTGYIVSWGNRLNGGISSKAHKGGVVDKVATAQSAFAVLYRSGKILTWGKAVTDDVSDTLSSSEFTDVVASSGAFAAINKKNGAVVTWGESKVGGNSELVKENLNGHNIVTQIAATDYAFVALHQDGALTTWGTKDKGCEISNSNKETLDKLVKLKFFSTSGAFAVLLNDKSIAVWGNKYFGAEIDYGYSKKIDGFQTAERYIFDEDSEIKSNKYAFAAKTSANKILVWGKKDLTESDYYSLKTSEIENVKSTFSTDAAFAFLKIDGSVELWGDVDYAGNESDTHFIKVNTLVKQGKKITSIASTNSAFAALFEDGSVVSWGNIIEGAGFELIK